MGFNSTPQEEALAYSDDKTKQLEYRIRKLENNVERITGILEAMERILKTIGKTVYGDK